MITHPNDVIADVVPKIAASKSRRWFLPGRVISCLLREGNLAGSMDLCSKADPEGLKFGIKNMYGIVNYVCIYLYVDIYIYVYI